jgi:hypothetical protein
MERPSGYIAQFLKPWCRKVYTVCYLFMYDGIRTYCLYVHGNDGRINKIKQHGRMMVTGWMGTGTGE